MATFHTRLVTALLVPCSPPVTRTFTNKTNGCIVTGGERLEDRTEGENSSTGKTKLQKKKSKQREVWKKALQGWERGVLCPRQWHRQGQDHGCGAGVQSRPHRGTWVAQQQGIVSLWPSEHGGAVGISQQVQAGQGVCGTSRVRWWSQFLISFESDQSLPSPEHPDCSSHSSSMSLMETNNLL